VKIQRYRCRLAEQRLRAMSTRRLAYWWLRLVFSGRFLAHFLTMARAEDQQARSDQDPPLRQR
jgi:hypothetical protein